MARPKRKPRLRVAAPPLVTIENPPGLPDDEAENLLAIWSPNALPEYDVRRGDYCTVWMGHPFNSGEFGAIHRTADDKVYLGLLRHGPGGYVTLEMGGESCLFKPSEYSRLGRVFSVEREGVTVKRFPVKGGAR